MTKGMRWAILALFLLLATVQAAWKDSPLRLAWFDACQQIFPRQPQSLPAIIVEIDEVSLARKGQWPWPRAQLAALIERIAAAGPAAIGLDMIFPEPDRYSPAQLALALPGIPHDLAAQLGQLPSGDATFARALQQAPTVLGLAGLDTAPPAGSREGSFTAAMVSGKNTLRDYPYSLRSIPILDGAASGHAILSAEPEKGVVRRVPLAASVGGQPYPALSIELLRAAAGEPGFRIRGNSSGILSVGVGDVEIPTEKDGRLWVYFSPRNAARFVSAADVLDGNIAPDALKNKLVLLGVTGVGMLDDQATPVGQRMPGVEIHAQVLENIFDNQLLRRPIWASWAEILLLVVPGLAAIFAPVWSLRRAVAALLLLLVPPAAALAAYRWGLLLDGATPSVGLSIIFSASLAFALARANLKRRNLEKKLQAEREQAARLAGEMDAARRIQAGMLPGAENAFPDETRFSLMAFMQPAKVVGGDFYDFFLLDPDRLFFMIGDVSGKGLPASLFMAISKTLCHSLAIRHEGNVSRIARAFNAELSHANPEMLFVTGVIGILDLRDGRLAYCNAGHDAPYRTAAASGALTRLEEGDGGPPFSVIENFPYDSAQIQLQAGDRLVLITDGITEATNPAGELFGAMRLKDCLEQGGNASLSPKQLCVSLLDQVREFESEAGPTDDKTLLVLQWKGATSL
ncbi:MAG: stage II sporulation E family protein [Gallionellaceae bacterium]|nr:MAG: stage II sporulation E family protein [Gallionellaceae bacterium]